MALPLETGKRSCTTATAQPWVQIYFLLSFTKLTQVGLVVGVLFPKLTVKIGHCRKQLLCQLLKHYFWIPKILSFQKAAERGAGAAV